MLSRLVPRSALSSLLSLRSAPAGFCSHSSANLTLTDSRTGKSVEIPIYQDTIRATDLKKLGLRSHDPGYMNTTCCASSISSIDGEKGALRYRGIPIETLAEKSTFPETAFLLLYGELPSSSELETFEKNLMEHAFVHQDITKLNDAFRYDAHPMGMFVSAYAAMGTLYPEQNPALTSQNVYKDPAVRNKQIMRILGGAPTLAAMAYRKRMGQEMVRPRTDMGFTENFLHMMDFNGEDARPHPKLVRALDILFLIHAEHEVNCSTATMRHLASSNVDVYTAVAAAGGALYGPRHGGANEAVLRMLEKIGDADNIDSFVEKVKNREEMLMGFGHRVYKSYDTRAKIVKTLADDVFSVCGREDLIETAMKLEKRALEDEFFISRKLYPNVDFYSGLIYKAMGFPTDMFPILFAVSRISGWLAHWQEWLLDPENRIYRPFQIYTGPEIRDYTSISDRPASSINPADLEVKHSAFGRRRDASMGRVHPPENYNWERDF